MEESGASIGLLDCRTKHCNLSKEKLLEKGETGSIIFLLPHCFVKVYVNYIRLY